MSDQIDLVKKNPSAGILWIEWSGWTTGPDFGWLEQRVRAAKVPDPDDVQSGEETFASDEAAIAALQRAIAKKLTEGFAYEDEAPSPPPPPPAKPSKAWAAGKAKPPRWLGKVDAKQVAGVRKAIDAAKLSHRSADIVSLLRPAIRLTLKTVKPAAVKGVVSRFGGDPDLPAKFAWPKQGKTPLAFVAQYRLEELVKHDLEGKLPKRGVIALFAHLIPEDGYGEHARAYYFADAKLLTRTAPPHAAAADGRPGKVALATASVVLTLPPPDHAAARSLKLTGDEHPTYHDQVWLAVCAGRSDPSGSGAHQLLGWPDMMDTNSYTKGWELLAQIDSDDRFDLELGDVETLRVHVAMAKLAKADLRSVRATMAAE